jgi:peptide/nickel transport system substrate-binding protein
LPNGSALFTIYLRRGLYWFNGSAVMPFTAWDVYAYFYIGMKAFWWYSPWINNSLTDEDIRVLNNYTIQFPIPEVDYLHTLLDASKLDKHTLRRLEAHY